MSCIITLSSGTFHVQNVTTRLFQNKQCVTCWFAQGTTAIGCHISFTDSKGNLVQETVARRQGNTLSAGDCAGDLPPGVYRVLASDINSSDVVDHRTAAIGKSLVTVTAKPSLQQTTSLTTQRSLSPSLFPSATTGINTVLMISWFNSLLWFPQQCPCPVWCQPQ